MAERLYDLTGTNGPWQEKSLSEPSGQLVRFPDALHSVRPVKVYDEGADDRAVDAALDAAWQELRGVREEAREENLAEPDEAAIQNAGILLPKLHAILGGTYHVYPTERGGVGISAPSRRGCAVVVECGPLDRVYCFVTLDGQSRRAKYCQMDGLPDEFINSALRALGG